MKIINKKAKFNYNLEPKRIEAGISLLGGEAKEGRQGKIDLTNAHARVIKNEVFLVNARIDVPGKKDYDPARTRKLLLHKKEIISLLTKIKQKKLTLVPTAVYTRHNLIKVELALGKIKKKFEKRQAIKKKDIEREIEKEFKTR